jgi:hypothetical protein
MRRSAPSARIPPCLALVACGLLAATVLASEPSSLKGVPADRAVLGEAFVDAWLAFRRDIDLAPHAGAHPALLAAWFASTPRFLARDAARVATHPSAVEAAAKRLVDGVRPEDLSLLALLERRAVDPRIAADLSALRIAAKDPEARRQSLSKLDSPEPIVALEGASALAAAGDGRGLEHLRRSLDRRDPSSGAAARALGLYGAEADVARLEAARSGGADPLAVDVGLGELAMRRFFPLQAEMLARRDPSGARFEADGGLYDTWLSAIGRAAAEGARDSKAVIAHVERERGAAQGFEGEPTRRDLQALVDFWSDVDLAIRATGTSIQWPGDFQEARRRLTAVDPDETPPVRFSRRFAAAIAVLAAAGPPLGYERLAPPTDGLRFLSAGGDRAADGNFATSWRGGDGAALVFDIERGEGVRRLWIAAGCAEAKKVSMAALRVRGGSGAGAWSIEHRFEGSSRYFEEVPLGAPRSGRVTVEISRPAGGPIACISELRAE